MNSAENVTVPSAATNANDAHDAHDATNPADGETRTVRPTTAAPSKRRSIRALKHAAKRAAAASPHRRGLRP
ncbi:hypothetical protein [Catenulispora rubra]|uniref:hypothetical protein n=1 Tax=Catenulispora rubra TaxID=280293 RepID=UPI0018921342|nr:hypothetical protein [Catenulispora rubra]